MGGCLLRVCEKKYTGVIADKKILSSHQSTVIQQNRNHHKAFLQNLTSFNVSFLNFFNTIQSFNLCVHLDTTLIRKVRPIYFFLNIYLHTGNQYDLSITF